jgi:3D (Asp-Asp-Asp) domain-containing protein
MTQSIPKQTWKIRRGRKEGVVLLILVMFLQMMVSPGQALALTNDFNGARATLVFVQDPALRDVALVGTEAWPEEKIVKRILNTSRFEVRANLGEGSAVKVLSTAYSSTVDQTDGNPFVTASGNYVAKGTAAANFLPLGTIIELNGETFTVWDRLNSRYNGQLIVDIWMPSRLEAINYGVRTVEMKVVRLP